MLSVLIPTYNYNAFFLVKEIHQQLILENIKFEIICFDDGSNSKLNLENEKINRLSFTIFKSLENNIGRSAIRNLLAKKANYNWLLFLDADVKLVDNNFIKNYKACFKEEKAIFCGGIIYENKVENTSLLRYKYGKKHEEISIQERLKNPEKYFLTSNFLIHKEVFSTVTFNENLKDYGYEDLFFAKKIIENSFRIIQLENQVYHLGLDNNSVFVEKTTCALKNLAFLLKEEKIDFKDTNLSSTYLKIKKLKLSFLLNFNLRDLTIKLNSLFFFNLFRLSYLHQIFKNS